VLGVVCVEMTAWHVVGDGATVYLECTSDMTPRRYLIVQIPTAGVIGIMNFCEIEVYVRRKSIRLLEYIL